MRYIQNNVIKLHANLNASNLYFLVEKVATAEIGDKFYGIIFSDRKAKNYFAFTAYRKYFKIFWINIWNETLLHSGHPVILEHVLYYVHENYKFTPALNVCML